MKKILVLTIITSFLVVSQGYSQQGGYYSVQYAMGFGVGDMSDFISAPSFRGAVMEYRNAFTKNIHAGLDVGWNVFYEKQADGTYSDGNQTLSGTQYRYQNEVPILVAIDYHFSPEKTLKPYVGLGIGTMYTERSTDMNLYRLKENPWHFAIKPEVGLLYELSFNTSVKVAAKYYNGFKAGSLETQGYLSISAGLAFTWF